MTGTGIRPFEPSDYAAARALWDATDGLGLSSADEPEAIAAYLARNPGLSLVAEAGGRIVGTILVGHDGRRGFIYHLAVDASARRNGLGEELVRKGLTGLAAAGIQKCHLMVIGANAEGRAFWSAIGAEHRVEIELYSFPLD